MNIKYAALACGTAALAFGFVVVKVNISPNPSVTLSACTSCTLVTEPDDGMTPLMDMLQRASSSVDLVIYELADRQIETALVATEKRGVNVRVLLNGGYQGTPDGTAGVNAGAFAFLQANGVAVRWTPPYFDLTHEKTLVTDDAQALIMSFNLVSKYYPTGRDFGVTDNNAADVAEIEAAFNADWNGKNDFQSNDGALVWSPGARPALLALINGATHSLDIYNEEMSDAAIIAALEDAARRGVVVRVLMTYSSEWKYEFQDLASSGVEVRTYDPDATLYIHAKAIIADGKDGDATDEARAFVGSENFSAASLDDNRELGIVLSNGAAISQLENTFNADWRNATPFEAMQGQ